MAGGEYSLERVVETEIRRLLKRKMDKQTKEMISNCSTDQRIKVLAIAVKFHAIQKGKLVDGDGDGSFFGEEAN